MTDALKKWVDQHPDQYFTQRIDEAEFWIRALVDEIEERAAKAIDRHGPFNAYGWAFTELKRELLGK